MNNTRQRKWPPEKIKKKAGKEDGAIGGTIECTGPAIHPTPGDAAITCLAKIFQTFMVVQWARDEQLETESARQVQ